jgi:hypothetical protein
VNRSAKYVTAIVVAHLLVNIAHGLAHRELRVGLDPPASIFVTVVVLVSPLLALALVWTTKKRIGLILSQNHLSFLRGDQLHSGQRMRGGSASPSFCSCSRTTAGL